MNTIKINLLKDAFEKRFDIDRFKKFVREFFNEPEMLIGTKSIAIWREYTDYVNSYYKIANYTDNEDNRLIVLAVELKRGGSIDRARSMQRNFISKVLDENNLEAAIVAFFNQEEPSWRLSFVRLDYAFTDKGLDLDLTPARRYSYLVGENEPNHTALVQLLPIFQDDEHNPTLDEIENAFSVEKVTKDFFAQYKDKYYELKEFLEQDESFIKEARRLGIEENKFAEQFAKKLMGQLAFLYFIQKKGWLGVKIVPKTILKSDLATIYNAVEERQRKILQGVYRGIDKNTYELKIDYISSDDFSEKDAEILSDIFSGNEKFDEPWGNGYKQFIREVLWKHCVKYNKNFFMDYLEPFFYDALNKSRKNYYFKTFNCKLPFLNAGLFEPLEGYDWSNTNFRIPNSFFSNKEEKKREADGILDIFDRYNFTMNEDEPLEKEVAIDPEMLGKIFENLLEASDRKSKGAFYTPREIVHYMCQESLINYLTNEVDVPYEDLKEFILYGELIKDADNRSGVGYSKEFTIKQSIFDNILKIDRALENVRIADPAVGSGAFPLGMLNEIIKARNNITEYVIKIDKAGELGQKYGEKHIRSRRSIYNMKLKTIKNSIFAVDIEPSAIDITKLRLWLSIVIEQEIDELNPEPHPLPNLDVNIHVGNSLIDEYEGIKLFDETILHGQDNLGSKNKKDDLQEQLRLFFDSDEILKEMYEKQSQYFDEYNEEKKKSLKVRIEELRDQLIIQRLKEMGKSDKIEDYNKIKNNRLKPYFIWELEFAKVFQEKGGFDIVIGNPPYVGFHNVPNKDFFRGRYYCANGKFDFYVLFIELGINILKNAGIITYICPSYFYKRDYGKKLRQLVLDGLTIKYIADFKDYQIFNSALTYTCIFGIEKQKNDGENFILVLDEELRSDCGFHIKQSSLSEPIWLFENDKSAGIINKVRKKCNISLGDITKSISQGIITGNNKVYIISKDLIEERCFNYNFLEKAYKGKNIRSGKLIESDHYLFYPYRMEKGKMKLVDETEIKNNNPKLYKYLFENKNLLQKREYFKKSNKKWYELWNPRKIEHFYSRKLVFSEINKNNDFVVVDKCFYTDSACGMELNEKHEKCENYLVSYLNSKLISYCYSKISVPKANGYLIYKNAFLKELPVYIDSFKEFSEKTKLDKYLYEIFEINKEEIEIIEQFYNRD